MRNPPPLLRFLILFLSFFLFFVVVKVSSENGLVRFSTGAEVKSEGYVMG